jgi:hypothetical protein
MKVFIERLGSLLADIDANDFVIVFQVFDQKRDKLPAAGGNIQQPPA